MNNSWYERCQVPMTAIYALTVLKVLWKTTSKTQIQVFLICFVDADDCRRLPR